jgi:putative chitinase
MSLYLPAPLLAKLWPHAVPAVISGISSSSIAILPKYGFDTLPNLIDFMAECSEETGGGLAFVESGAYTAERAHEVWPGLFPTAQSAQIVVGNPRVLFDKTYGGRLGNKSGTDDGYNFRGRGMIQITGRAWYTEIAKETGLDLVNHPELVSGPAYMLQCAASFWKLDKVVKTVGNLRAEVKLINGGYTNMAQREAWEALWTKNLTLEAVTYRPVQNQTILRGPVGPVGSDPDRPNPVTPEGFLHPTLVQEFEAFFKRWL